MTTPIATLDAGLGPLPRPLAFLVERMAAEIRYRRALRELGRLDDRDLDDLGLGRADLPALARRHARAGS